MKNNNGMGTVAIAGAGIGGLVLALALRQRGIECEVFEQQPSLAEVGAGITLWANALCALESVGAAAAVRNIGCPSLGGIIGRSDGCILVEASSAALGHTDELLLTLHRAELQKALYDLLPPSCVRFGAGFRRFQHRDAVVEVDFEGQPPVTCSVLVGADGLRSKVREQLAGPHPARYAGYIAYRGVCPIPVGWRGVCGEFWGNGDRFGLVRIPGERLYWFAVVNRRQGAVPSPPHKAALLSRFNQYRFEVPQVIDATDEGAILVHEVFDRAPLKNWSRGGVCLLGDAAHPTTPNLGQGAAMAIESAVVLARALSEANGVDSALVAYAAARQARTARVTRVSRSIGMMAQLRNPVLKAARNFVIRHTTERGRYRQLQWLLEYDAATVPLWG